MIEATLAKPTIDERGMSSRHAPPAKKLAESIDAALKANLFCEPERSLIVQIVCDVLSHAGVETREASTPLDSRKA